MHVSAGTQGGQRYQTTPTLWPELQVAVKQPMRVLGSKFRPTQQSVYPPMSLHPSSHFTVEFRLIKRKHPITYPEGINGTGDTLLTFQ